MKMRLIHELEASPDMNSSLRNLAAITLPVFYLVPATARAADPPNYRTLVTTNFVVVTNMVLVTNYVQETVTNLQPVKEEPKPAPPVPLAALPNQGAKLPSIPMGDSADWVQLTSGEWLRGKIRSLVGLKLDFDSDKLNEQIFDWKDVAQLYSPRAFCLYGDNITAAGAIHVDKDTVTVIGPEPVTFSRNDLDSVSSGAMTERDYWSMKLTLGMNYRTGNTKEITLTSTLSVTRVTPKSDLDLELSANYGALGGVEDVNNLRSTLSDDILVSKRIFVRPLSLEYDRDIFQNIAHRGIVAVGAGYYFYKRPDLLWLAGGGLGYQFTQFDNVEAGASDTSSTVAGILATEFRKDLSQRTTASVNFEQVFANRESGSLTSHLITTLSVHLTRRLDLDFSFTWDRTENPKTDSSGVVPQKNDFLTSTSLGVRF